MALRGPEGMLERFEFEELESPDEFVRLCSDVLEAEGAENLRGFGRPPTNLRARTTRAVHRTSQPDP